MDGFRNIIQNPHVGLVFVIPGRSETLSINGSARIVTDGPFFDGLVVGRHRPDLAIVLDVVEVFFHCPKAFMRASVWRPEAWDPDAVRSYAAIAKALWRREDPIAAIEDRLRPELFESQLYPHPDETR
jgi:uncharacterized protein